ncbi:HutD/Ves family protein [Paraburkholderia bannensis]|uniref:HutD/Ves family protein n=1 Tax=Paraburkholderia bannensis TaxID=765414 RepID=UPI0005A7EC4D|nr:HutD family protein [Paraburkholderia bannensis]
MSRTPAPQAEHAARLTLLRGADLVASPWKNGGGVTREIALGGSPEAFAWRVSVADVAQAGPFSRFDGVARTLVLLEGAGMVLDETGDNARTHALMKPLDVARFDGEAPISARLIDGATRDFNLMVRRDVARATFEIWREPVKRDLVCEASLLYCASGVVNVRVNGGEHVPLAAGDTLRIDTTLAARTLQIETEGEGALLAIALESIKP